MWSQVAYGFLSTPSDADQPIVFVSLTYWAAAGVAQDNGSEVCISGTRRVFASSVPESQTPARTDDLPEQSSKLETGAPARIGTHRKGGRVVISDCCNALLPC